jgi:hypothetical protein
VPHLRAGAAQVSGRSGQGLASHHCQLVAGLYAAEVQCRRVRCCCCAGSLMRIAVAVAAVPTGLVALQQHPTLAGPCCVADLCHGL